MDWGRLFAGTFWLIFLAELGDKTQLAAMARAGGGPAGWTARWVVFLGASTALVASTAIAVFLGGWLFEKLIPDPRYVRIASGILFLVFGFSMLYSVFFTCQGEMAHPEASASQPQAEQSARGYLARLALQAAL
ncbi:MAG: TMEM165/GDT1 family protein, partial [Planctomycetota bacterium]|nr:TMEM165/GDT1 family protein [Planctomycetota bacterium]